MEATTSSALESCLGEFSARVNAHDKVKRLLHNWNRVLIVEATDSGRSVVMEVRDEHVRLIARDDAPESAGVIQIQAEEEVLTSIFSGSRNPAVAAIDGEIAVFADDADQMKLDAVVMLLWN